MFSLFSLVLGNKDILLSFGISHTSVFIYLLLFLTLFDIVSLPLQFLKMY